MADDVWLFSLIVEEPNHPVSITDEYLEPASIMFVYLIGNHSVDK